MPSVRRTWLLAAGMAFLVNGIASAQQPEACTGEVTIPAERYVGAQVGVPVRNQLVWWPYVLKVAEGQNRYVYTAPPPQGVVEWAYEVVPPKDCIVNVAIAWAETAYQKSPGIGGPARTLRLYRSVSDGTGRHDQTDYIGSFAGSDTGGWENFREANFSVALKKGFLNRLVLRTAGDAFQLYYYPIPHVLHLKLSKEMTR